MKPTRLSEFLRQARESAGLRPGELALRAGWKSGEAGGNFIAKLEREGDTVASDAELGRIASALGIAPETVASLESDERRNARAEWEAWAREPVPISLMVRMMPTVWQRISIPDGLTDRSDILSWARDHPTYSRLVRCLVWSRTESTYLREDGSSYDARSGFGDPDAGPGISIR